MKVALISAVWDRVPLTRIWWGATNRLRTAFLEEDYEVEVFVAGSQDEHRELCWNAGAGWVEVENNYLGAKWNCVARAALDWGADYLFILGSDDFFSTCLIPQYSKLIQRRTLHVGLQGVYIYEPMTDRTLALIADTRGNYPSPPGACVTKRSKRSTPAIGTGRLLHRSIFAGRDYFWEPSRNRALDASITATLRLPPAKLITPGPDQLVVDVKTGTNIWSFDTLVDVYPNCLLPSSDILAPLPEWEDIRSLAVSTQPG